MLLRQDAINTCRYICRPYSIPNNIRLRLYAIFGQTFHSSDVLAVPVDEISSRDLICPANVVFSDIIHRYLILQRYLLYQLSIVLYLSFQSIFLFYSSIRPPINTHHYTGVRYETNIRSKYYCVMMWMSIVRAPTAYLYAPNAKHKLTPLCLRNERWNSSRCDPPGIRNEVIFKPLPTVFIGLCANFFFVHGKYYTRVHDNWRANGVIDFAYWKSDYPKLTC